MKPLYTGIIISPEPEKIKEQTRDLTPLVDITHTFSTFDRANEFLKTCPDCLVFLDISRDRDHGVKYTRKIKKQSPTAKIFIVDHAPSPETIMEGFRSGALDFLPLSGESGELAQKVRAALDREGGCPPQGEMITLFSLKGGVGLTTTAINLADQIYRLTDEKVLLLDLNLFMGDVIGYLDIHPGFTPYDLVTDLDRMDSELLFSSLYRHDRGFYILTAQEEINDSDSIGTRDMIAMVDLLKSQFDYIVADAPHDFSRRTLTLVDRTDTLMVMAQQSLPSVKSVQKIMEFLSDIRFDSQRISLVLSRHMRSGGLTRGDLETSFGRKIDYIIPNDYGACLKAATRGITLAQASDRDKIMGQVTTMARDITGVSRPKSRGLKAFFARVKS